MKVSRLLIVGSPEPTHVGHHLADAARALDVSVAVCDVRRAYEGGAIRRRLWWYLRGRRPVRLRSFAAEVLRRVRTERPDVVLTTGLAPLDVATLRAIGREGVRRVNFLTDDPWNPVHRAPWFLAGLPHYDQVWSPRQANLHDLRVAGVRRVEYLPFACNPSVHYPEAPADEREWHQYDSDVLLAGGADPDRVPYARALIGAGCRVALHGGYWDRYRATRRAARGFLDAAGLRKATGAARVCLGLVRRANRDGHAMRTYEIPAMGGCLLAERTSDHERLFGREGECVMYFSSPREAVDRVKWLLAHPAERDRMAAAGRALIAGGRHTYADRLATILGSL